MSTQLGRLLVPLALMTALAACGGQTNTQPEEEVNLIELQREAIEAYERRDWVAAERHYTQLVQKAPKDAETWFRLGNIFARVNQVDNAVRAYREALIRNPDNARAWNNMGVVQLRQAANTFRELYNNSELDNPLNERAGELFKALTELLEKGPNAGDALSIP